MRFVDDNGSIKFFFLRFEVEGEVDNGDNPSDSSKQAVNKAYWKEKKQEDKCKGIDHTSKRIEGGSSKSGNKSVSGSARKEQTVLPVTEETENGGDKEEREEDLIILDQHPVKQTQKETSPMPIVPYVDMSNEKKGPEWSSKKKMDPEVRNSLRLKMKKSVQFKHCVTQPPVGHFFKGQPSSNAGSNLILNLGVDALVNNFWYAHLTDTEVVKMFEISGFSLGAAEDIRLQIVNQFRSFTRDKLISVLHEILGKLTDTSSPSSSDISKVVLSINNE